MLELLLITFLIFLLGILLLFILKRKKLGILTGDVVYSDTDASPGEVLYSKTLNLVGKPDYLIRKDGVIYPVEVKTGKTPLSPYENHTMQLMAYCLLVEENYNMRPPGGFLKYPGKEFKIKYTEEAKKSVQSTVQEILDARKSGKEIFCDHKQHQ